MVLILCVDRDDDIGRKTKIKGPIIGEKDNISAATKLILSDPEDTDANAIFSAIKLHREIKKSQIATLTGNVDVGVKSDEIIAKQLNKVLKKTKEKKIIFITDGAEDEHILPLIQNKAEIVSVKRVIIKQNERLEGMYYLIKNFIEDRKLARTVFGVPAIILLLIAIFGVNGWRIVLGGIGAYLIIKAFGIDDFIAHIYSEFVALFKKGHVSSLLYSISGLFILIGIVLGYNGVSHIPLEYFDKILLLFISNSIYSFFVSGIFFWLGRAILIINNKRSLKHHMTYLSLLFAITIIIKTAIDMLLTPELGYTIFVLSIIVGFIVVGVFLYVEKKL